MTTLEIIFLGIILSLDAFWVSFSYGLFNLKNFKRIMLSIAFGVAFFQFLMPVLGAFLAGLVFNFIKTYSNYLAGLIFIFLGVKLFIDASAKKDEIDCESEKVVDVTFKVVLMLSIATSLDALAAGTSLYFLHVDVLFASLIIGIITFINSICGFLIAKKIRHLAPNFIGKLGGLLLVIIGLKTIFL